jgi:predicted dehydrogenase
MSAWVAQHDLGGRVQVSTEWPTNSDAIIVANAAYDHERAVEHALSLGAAVLVEKPFAPTFEICSRLVNMANQLGVRLAPAHVFLFARYIHHFSRVVHETERIQSVRICWTDPVGEARHGESKQYDPSVPIHLDCLPHVMSILSTLIPTESRSCKVQKIRGWGTHMEFCLEFDRVLCHIEMRRNSDLRRRIVEVKTRRSLLKLDFSKEPGTIFQDTRPIISDPEWEFRRRPMAEMLNAFLIWASGGERDPRFDMTLALQTSRTIDQISSEVMR